LQSEVDAARRGGNYFDKNYGRGVDGYIVISDKYFDLNSFISGSVSKYYNGRRFRNEGNKYYSQGRFPAKSRFHWSDVPINLLFNGGLGTLGYLFR
jgi:hypothetical protein